MSAAHQVGDRFDLVCIGDVSVDLYLTLALDQVSVDRDETGQHLVLPFGAKVPSEVSATVPAGGNAANASIACARLGLRVALAAYLGADAVGREAVIALQAEGVDPALTRLDDRVPTNRNVILRVGHERTILVNHEPHEYHWPYLRPSEIPAWIYLSSVGRAARRYEDEIADWLEARPDVSLAFAPGSLQVARGVTELARLYRRASVVVCNREEAAAITGRSPSDEPAALLEAMLALGPEQVVVTDASAGAYGATADRMMHVPVFPDHAPVVDRTGAGDAFTGTLVAGLVAGRSLDEAMLRAPVNAMSVVQSMGTQAGLLRADELEALLADAAPSYGLRPIT
jgi:ribokinase